MKNIYVLYELYSHGVLVLLDMNSMFMNQN